MKFKNYQIKIIILSGLHSHILNSNTNHVSFVTFKGFSSNIEILKRFSQILVFHPLKDTVKNLITLFVMK